MAIASSMARISSSKRRRASESEDAIEAVVDTETEAWDRSGVCCEAKDEEAREEDTCECDDSTGRYPSLFLRLTFRTCLVFFLFGGAAAAAAAVVDVDVDVDVDATGASLSPCSLLSPVTVELTVAVVAPVALLAPPGLSLTPPLSRRTVLLFSCSDVAMAASISFISSSNCWRSSSARMRAISAARFAFFSFSFSRRSDLELDDEFWTAVCIMIMNR